MLSRACPPCYSVRMHTRYRDIKAFITKDGSEIRELMHPSRHRVRHQSLAEATVLPGHETLLHKHRQTEEIYYILQGRGRMTLGDEEFDVAPGDTICIAPDTAHKIFNTGESLLKILCACAPPYSDGDSELLQTVDGH